MDTEKLLRVLTDTQTDEADLTITAKIEAIRAFLAQNSPEGFNSANSALSELITAVRDTAISYAFSRTENIILEKAGGKTFFGQGLIDQLENIFNHRSFELVTRLDEYRSQRDSFIKRNNKLTAALLEIGVESYRPNEYEVGLVLPEEEGGIDNFGKRISQLKNLLSALAEACGKDSKGIKINRLSNGSLELFSLQPAEVALLLSSLLLNVSDIWDKVAKFRKKINDTDKEEILSKDGKKEIKKVFEREAEKLKKEILDDLPEKCLDKYKKDDNGRRNEIRNQIAISIKAIFAWFEVGIEVDITPIRVEVEGEPTTKETRQIQIIEQVNEKLGQIYKLPIEDRKLPFQLPEPVKTIEEISVVKKTTKKKKPKPKDVNGNS